MEQNLSDIQRDAFNETANIGAGQAATALSILLGQQVNITTPLFVSAPLKEIGKHISSTPGTLVGIYTKLTKGIGGNILILLPPDSAFALLEDLGRADAKKQLEKTDFEILNKIGTIICSAYLTGLAQFFEQHIEFKRPNVISSVGSSIVDFASIDMRGDEATLLVRIEFNAENPRIRGSFVLLFTTISMMPLLNTFTKKMGVTA